MTDFNKRIEELEAKYAMSIDAPESYQVIAGMHFRNGANAARELMQKEIDDFKSGVNNFKCFTCGGYNSPFVPVNLYSEIKSLQEKLDVAVEALKNIKQHQSGLMVGNMNISTTFRIANEALNKLKGLRDE